MMFGLVPDPEAGKQAEDFQFPLGIRWCSDKPSAASLALNFVAFNSLWELDGVRTVPPPLLAKASWSFPFNSLWELDGVRTGKTSPQDQ